MTEGLGDGETRRVGEGESGFSSAFLRNMNHRNEEMEKLMFSLICVICVICGKAVAICVHLCDLWLGENNRVLNL